MKILDITTFLAQYAPPAYQETYDNAGLITGNAQAQVSQALVCLDCTEAVINEAVKYNCNLIIAHHPIVFKGLKTFTGKTYVERVIIKAIQNNIAIYAIHTNLDNVLNGVNGKIAQKLSLINCKILAPKVGILNKLITYSPLAYANKIRQALFAAGAGNMGNYSETSFNSEGTGTFKGNDNSQAFVGKKNTQHHEAEIKIEVIFEAHLATPILKALRQYHPYEKVAYDIIALNNAHQQVGSGLIGELSEEIEEHEFLQHLKNTMQVSVIRHTQLLGKKIKTVALCGGSGSFLLGNAVGAGADIFISADFKYHEFFDADNKILIADIGHYESEQFTQELLIEIITKKFPTFAIRLTENNTNPIKYLA
ncbi:MAG: Nif3-like dinuclear metal center hexameric protein [Sphingobacteriales bacterium]|nr:MAG: Nif3-like dinuclear metal center hexameric protein [Sphingobacteriales bacterium]